ncbi:hypothetical protein GCM10009555_064510 [Acrocarpospora macrocephala]|uniref:Uncharacterized protein n=1 Tax=Acrocarpospora macrocephala TaxID=150177 RepID=A0A5M3WF61_9ACTN|nr:hypothetical protein [Acrocarpospora macrocephala]GES07614.1 hypothetical protein Amac_012090 [Acrocarpospora macrocephala]
MPDYAFYTDRTGRSVARISEAITPLAWRGLVILIQQRLDGGSLARAFPEYGCMDDRGRNTITGTDRENFLAALEAHIPQLTEPPPAPEDEWGDPPRARSPLDRDTTPGTFAALDLIDFVAMHIDQPSSSSHHAWGGDHIHYYFSADGYDPFFESQLTPGQQRLQDEIEQLFRRTGIAFTLGDDMRVHRLGPPEARALISDFRPNTGDSQLDDLLNGAFTRFLSRVPTDRQDAIEKLWDAFERLKTLELGDRKQKLNSIAQLLDRAAPEPFRGELDNEFKTLTDIGNQFRIRHHEHGSHDLPNDAARDYLFIRCASLIAHVLRQTGRMTDAEMPQR